MADVQMPALRVERNPWLQGFAATPFLFALACLAVAPWLSLHWTIFGALTFFLAWRRNLRPRFHEVDVLVDDQVVRLGSELIPRAELTNGVIGPHQRGVLVRLSRKLPKHPVEIVVPNEEHGSQLLAALGFDVDQSVAKFRGMSQVYRSRGSQIALGAAGLAIGGTAGLAGMTLGPIGVVVVVLVAALSMGMLQLAPTSIQVGADGVLLKWLAYERWIPHRAIEQVRISNRRWGTKEHTLVVLTLEDGTEVPIPVISSRFDQTHAELVATRIRSAKSRSAQGGATDLGALLRRGDRAREDWIAALRTSAERATHRTAPVAPERLWRVLEDAQAAPLDRAAASVALATDDHSKKRIGDVAQATADRRLRVVLDHAADDDETLLEALAELEAEETSRVPKSS